MAIKPQKQRNKSKNLCLAGPTLGDTKRENLISSLRPLRIDVIPLASPYSLSLKPLSKQKEEEKEEEEDEEEEEGEQEEDDKEEEENKKNKKNCNIDDNNQVVTFR